MENINDPEYKQWVAYLHDLWLQLGKKIKPEVIVCVSHYANQSNKRRIFCLRLGTSITVLNYSCEKTIHYPGWKISRVLLLGQLLGDTWAAIV